MLVQEPSSGFRLLQDTIAHLDPLQRLENQTITENYVGPCVTTYRTLYGAVESPPNEIQHSVPSILDPRRFETLRWLDVSLFWGRGQVFTARRWSRSQLYCTVRQFMDSSERLKANQVEEKGEKMTY
jgi:hypothetical protein